MKKIIEKDVKGKRKRIDFSKTPVGKGLVASIRNNSKNK